MMNQYLKRCISKGWVRASQVSPRRISYFLTPEGFKEKSLMVKDYLSHSLTLFRDAKAQCEEIFDICQKNGWKKIGLVGEGDLADIARLVAQSFGVSVDAYSIGGDSQGFGAFLVVDMVTPQVTYDFLRQHIEKHRLFALGVLQVSEEKGV